jgi:AcrR family transcriptional regulator
MARQKVEQQDETPCSPRWKRRPESRPDELLDAAIEVFGEQGFAKTRLEEVGRRAGVTKGTVYLYFDSKEALFRAMVRDRIGRNVEFAEQFVREFQGTARELLVAFIRRYWGVMMQPETARLARVVHAELGNFPELARFYMQEVVLRTRKLIMQIIDRGVASGEFRQVEPVFTARALQILCVHMAQFQHWFRQYDDRPMPDEAVVNHLVDLYIRGLAPAPAGGKEA